MNPLETLLLTGKIDAEDSEQESSELALALLRRSLRDNYTEVLELLYRAFQSGSTGMIAVTLALLMSQSPQLSWLELRPRLQTLLEGLDATVLAKFTILLHNKTFGPGLGSRIQKLLRQILETWTEETIEFYITAQSRDFYSLLKLIHPKFSPNKNKLIKDWISQ